MMGFSQESINWACVVLAQYGTSSRPLLGLNGDSSLFDELIASEYVYESGINPGMWFLTDLGVKAANNYRPEFGLDAQEERGVGG